MKKQKKLHLNSFYLKGVVVLLGMTVLLFLLIVKQTGKVSTTSPISKELLSYHDPILGISFNYPESLGPAHTLDDVRKNQNWHRIDFNKGGFEAGYYEVSASTAKYQPVAGEGSPHFFDEKVVFDESTDSVKNKLEEAHFIPVSVKRVQSTNGIPAFRAYVVFCYGPCDLERLYIIPMNSQKYSNILMLTVMGTMYAEPTTNNPLPIDQTKQFALHDSTAIEAGTAPEELLNIAKGQDLIFNSLRFDK